MDEYKIFTPNKLSALTEDSTIVSSGFEFTEVVEETPINKKIASNKLAPINNPAVKLFFMILRFWNEVNKKEYGKKLLLNSFKVFDLNERILFRF